MVATAEQFIAGLTPAQKLKALYPFDSDERFNFHFFPIPDRKGVPMDELTAIQKDAAMALIKTCLSEQATKKALEIMSLEVVLKELENRKPEDHYRDPGKYYVVIFGLPGKNTVWGWRLEGHHISFTFSVDKQQLISGTPGFLGSNPGTVLQGPKKGTQVLKEETDGGFSLINSLSAEAKAKAIIDDKAPADIITFISRKAMIDNPRGLGYNEMPVKQQQDLLQLINLYIHRYTKTFADKMLKEIQQAGLEKLVFAWAGSTVNEIGNPYYYRIQGPTIIIELDNTQNNANHVHTVVRDLKHDFGGDELLQHYKDEH